MLSHIVFNTLSTPFCNLGPPAPCLSWHRSCWLMLPLNVPARPAYLWCLGYPCHLQQSSLSAHVHEESNLSKLTSDVYGGQSLTLHEVKPLQ